MSRAAFDPQADAYEAELERGLSVTGEDRSYFALGRVRWLRARLEALGARRDAVLDFGCGNGGSTPLLTSLAPAVKQVCGVDVSERSLEIARTRHGGPCIEYALLEDCAATPRFDVAYTNGVFHHIPPPERGASLAYIRERLLPGGYFGLFENNPWNPGTRWVMRRIAFDRDAIPLPPPEAARLVAAAGFEVVRTDFLFWFPRALSALRWIEPWLAGLPLGGQYMVLARKAA